MSVCADPDGIASKIAPAPQNGWPPPCLRGCVVDLANLSAQNKVPKSYNGLKFYSFFGRSRFPFSKIGSLFAWKVPADKTGNTPEKLETRKTYVDRRKICRAIRLIFDKRRHFHDVVLQKLPLPRGHRARTNYHFLLLHRKIGDGLPT